MRDTQNHYVIELTNGTTFEVTLPLGEDQSAFYIDQYYKGRISRLWINGEEWLEPTE